MECKDTLFYSKVLLDYAARFFPYYSISELTCKFTNKVILHYIQPSDVGTSNKISPVTGFQHILRMK